MADPILLAFITGLTTGGLSCLAIQGGLLTASLANQLEQDMMKQPVSGVKQSGSQGKKASTTRGTRGKISGQKRTHPNTALPIALFLLAKLVAYTLLGALLGWAGSFLAITPLSRAILMLIIGIFMVGNGLRMLNVHPIFRYFNLEPPKFITRYIRRTAKNGTELFTPLFLGALTVFIPCGVTQAMMAAALGTGSALMGATLMFAFTLGTSVLFFGVAYLATQLGARLERYFMTFVAITVLVFGFITINSALNLMGSPLSYENITRRFFAVKETVAASAPSTEFSNAVDSGETGLLELSVQNGGYYPSTLYAKAGSALTLSLVTENTRSCARDFVIPALKYYKLLPETGQELVEIPPQEPGTIMRFTCSMGMYTGQIQFGN
jgi:sulfite exporter TauE/SafE